MSTVNGLGNNSIIYSPAIDAYKNTSNLLKQSNLAAPSEENSFPSLDSLYALSPELSSLDKGVELNLSGNSTQSADNSTTNSILNNMNNPVLNGYTEGQGLLQGLEGQGTNEVSPDSITPLSSELSMLEEGMNINGVSESGDTFSLPNSDDNSLESISALSNELNLLEEGINVSNIPQISDNAAGSSASTRQNNLLSYSYNPSTGIRKSAYNNTNQGSILDLSV